MRLARVVVATLLLPTFALAAFVPRAAMALSPPDSARIDALESAAAEWNSFRVTTRRARWSLHELEANGYGIIVEPAQKRAAVVTISSAKEPRRVSWADIETVEGRRTSFSRGHTVVGGLIGGALGLGLGWTAFYFASFEGEADAWVIYTPAVFFAATGASIGAAVPSATKWRSLYP